MKYSDIDFDKIFKQMENDENLKLSIRLLSKYCFDRGRQYGEIIGPENAYQIFKKKKT